MHDSLWAFWAKSDASGRPHSLIGHLLDTGAVAELIWADYLAPGTQRRWDAASNGQGRDLFVLSCALHDIGKLTPAFQVKDPALWASVKAAGFRGVPDSLDRSSRQHWRTGACIVKEWVRRRGVPELEWLAAVVEGHHGRHEPVVDWKNRRASGDGGHQWQQAQVALADEIAAAFGIDPGALAGGVPPRATQLAFAGYVVMADWIASSHYFGGTGTTPMTVDDARARARRAWQALGFARGWVAERLDAADPLARFGVRAPRPLQAIAVAAAQSMQSPGLLVIEAPMGEGKTEAGLAVAEVLGARFGSSGLVFAMPTQGTTDAMYSRVVEWAAAVDASVPVSLLHGKAMLNEEWRRRQQAVPESDDETDEFGMASVYGEVSDRSVVSEPLAPQWVQGRHRGLLSHIVVATVDQVLYAATRTKFVSLRHAGLAGKILIVDEVHSYDVYMSTFLEELLRWCADAGVPVVLMSATLAPSVRQRLIGAYAPALRSSMPERDGYPAVTTVGESGVSVTSASPYRADRDVSVEVADVDPEDLAWVADRIDKESSGGGCVLVILNTVDRAQRLYGLLREREVPCRLLHGRLTTAVRADRTNELVELLGAERTLDTGRPQRLVVVATQIAEQSFDADADLLVTDIAPMDLWLQRVGRLHRHERPETDRPNTMRSPRVLVLGARRTSAAPEFAAGPQVVYGRYALLRSALLLGEGTTWQLPSQVPTLVAAAYDGSDLAPDSWGSALRESREAETTKENKRSSRAATFRLTPPGGLMRPDLAGLHAQTARSTDDEAHTVRDGDPTREVALVVRCDDGYRALDGTPLGPNGERCSELRIARKVWGDTVRLKERDSWVGQLRPLAGWAGVPMVAFLPSLVLDENLVALEGGGRVRFDPELGLLTALRGEVQ